MMRRRIEELYGHGAAHVALCAEPIHVGEPDHALRRAFEMFGRDLRAEGLARSLRYGSAPLLGLALVALLALATVLSRPRLDDTDIELVPFEVAQAEPLEPALEEPAPEPAPEPEVAVEPAPAPPPPPVVREMPKPPPVVAQRPPEPPASAPRRAPPPKAAPEPPPRPRVQIDSVARAAQPEPPAARPLVARANPSDSAPRPRVDVAPLAAAPAPDLAPPPEPARERFRLASAAPAAARPTVRVDPLRPPAETPPAAPSPRVPPRRDAPASARPAPPRPDLAPAARPAVALPSEDGARARTARVAPALEPGRDARRADVDVAPLGRAPSAAPRAAAPPPRVARSEPIAAPSAGPRRSDAEEQLAGVPLGSLAACVSDAREDALKQQVIAAVTTQKECVSEAGHYRFLQTKNLNSFLMFVERAPGRGESDRCVELRHALDCLERSPRTRNRTS